MSTDRDHREVAEWEGVVKERLPIAILAIGLVAAGSLLLALTSPLTFIGDDWNLLLFRPGWGVDQLFDHFNGHPIMAPALIYKVLQEIFGMESARPMQVAAIGTFLLMNVLLFIYLRRRVGDWVALIGTFLILFLGAAFEDLLWAFQIGYFGSLATGIGALIALDRDDRDGDIAASILLVVSIMFSSLGLAFIAAAFVEWILNPRDRRGRWFVPGASVIFYVIWWLGWGSRESAGSMSPEFSISVLPKVPGYVFDAFSSGLVSLGGLATGAGYEPEQPNLIWGYLGAVGLISFAIWRARKFVAMPRDLLIAASGLAAVLFLFALGHEAFLAYGPIAERPPTASRYQLPIAVFIVLALSALLQGMVIKRVWLATGGVVALVAISNGIQFLTERATEGWQKGTAFTRSNLAGIEAARPDVVPNYGFRLSTGFILPAQLYYRAVDDYGSPAFTPAQIRNEEVTNRLIADEIFIEATGIEVSGFPPPFSNSSCRTLRADRNIDLEPGRYVVINKGEGKLSVKLARLSDPPGVDIGAILPNARAGLDLPKGTLDDPWTISFTGEGPAGVCEAR